MKQGMQAGKYSGTLLNELVYEKVSGTPYGHFQEGSLLTIYHKHKIKIPDWEEKQHGDTSCELVAYLFQSFWPLEACSLMKIIKTEWEHVIIINKSNYRLVTCPFGVHLVLQEDPSTFWEVLSSTITAVRPSCTSALWTRLIPLGSVLREAAPSLALARPYSQPGCTIVFSFM